MHQKGIVCIREESKLNLNLVSGFCKPSSNYTVHRQEDDIFSTGCQHMGPDLKCKQEVAGYF